MIRNMTEENDGIIGLSKEATESGFKAILKVTGVLTPLKRKESTFKNDDGSPSKDQVELVLEDAIVLQMANNLPIPELKDDRFMDWMPYAKRGEQPSKQSAFVRGFVKSAEKLQEAHGKPECGWREYVGEVVTLERLPISWTFNKGKDNEEKKEVLSWHFVDNGDSTLGLDEAVAKLIEGKSPQMAARDIMMDARTKNQQDIRNAVRSGQPIAGLEVIDGKYQSTTSVEEATAAVEADDSIA
uniref:Uncharacterized protein n=1 Tax=viral metagenome TaxID=1070528 RepID=A0A6M3JMQ8_9ZZZZ